MNFYFFKNSFFLCFFCGFLFCAGYFLFLNFVLLFSHSLSLFSPGWNGLTKSRCALCIFPVRSVTKKSLQHSLNLTLASPCSFNRVQKFFRFHKIIVWIRERNRIKNIENIIYTGANSNTEKKKSSTKCKIETENQKSRRKKNDQQKRERQQQLLYRNIEFINRILRIFSSDWLER